MGDKEHINTLISVGAGLPPVNPYLDDQNQSDDDDGSASLKSKNKAGRKPSAPVQSTATKTIAPDPKEYIAELERPEDEDILY